MVSKKYFWLASIIILGLSVIKVTVWSANTKDVKTYLSSLSWKVDNPKNITQANISKRQVGDFVNVLMKADYSGLCNQHGEEIGEYMFMDLNNDNTYELILTSDGTCGRKIYNTVVIVSRRDDEFGYQVLYHLYNVLDLSTIIKDLNRDGRQELLITKVFSDYCGTCPKAFWTHIYTLREGKYVEASRNFPDYYFNQVIPRLEKKISELQAKQYVSEDMKRKKEIILSCYYVELDKALRFFSIDNTAGFERAKEWMVSDIPELRRNAVAVFQEIINEESLQCLAKLAKDIDKNVAFNAKRALDKLQR